MVAQSSSKMADVKPNCVVSNCIISLPFSTPPFVQPPFLKQLPKSNLQLLNMAQEASSNAFLHFHNSIVSTAAKCLKLLHSVVSPHHPLFSKFLSFSSHFQDFCQVHTLSLSLSLVSISVYMTLKCSIFSRIEIHLSC